MLFITPEFGVLSIQIGNKIKFISQYVFIYSWIVWFSEDAGPRIAEVVSLEPARPMSLALSETRDISLLPLSPTPELLYFGYKGLLPPGLKRQGRKTNHLTSI
jgi:hypothetical protein